jgi:hypothetical protein
MTTEGLVEHYLTTKRRILSPDAPDEGPRTSFPTDWSKEDITTFARTTVVSLLCSYLVDHSLMSNPVLDLKVATDWPRECLQHIKSTPIKLGNLVLMLDSLGTTHNHLPVLEGLTNGFRIEYKKERKPTYNPSKVPDDPVAAKVIDDAIAKDWRAGRLLGPFPASPPFLGITMTSPVSAIPKKSDGEIQEGLFRLITNGSWGKIFGTSVNCGISKEDAHVDYTRFDDFVSHLRQLGPGAQMWRNDVVEAFKQLPGNPQDIPLQGFIVRGQWWFDTTFLFGFRTGPSKFSAVAETMRDTFARLTDCPHLKNLLDDYFHATKGRDSRDNHLILDTFLGFLDAMGLPWAPKKLFHPKTTMTILGLQVDTEKMEISMPQKRMDRLEAILPTWEGKTEATKQEYQQLVGTLSYTCYGVRCGRTFLRRLIDATKGAPFKHTIIPLSDDSLADIRWWIRWRMTYSGISIIIDPEILIFDFRAVADACKPRCAGVWGNKWFIYDFTETDELLIPKIHHKEAFAVVGTCKTMMSSLSGKTLLFECDNDATVKALNKGRCKDPILMKLVRELFYLCAQGSFKVICRHLAGKLNVVADALSRPKKFHLAWVYQPTLDTTPTEFLRPTLDW